eukprot:scaffold503_cov365-Prasinococcus_capsulatus_cf.AAC.8
MITGCFSTCGACFWAGIALAACKTGRNFARAYSYSFWSCTASSFKVALSSSVRSSRREQNSVLHLDDVW